ncbi:hypothetical protein PENSPDRAFT_652855 [Peniophora sp. CONT]|nr:hypothetical protein PENSPDRAFT_652855 [Peniophora sp. CONT]
MHPYTPREMYLHELAALVGSQVLRYFREVAPNVPRLNPLKDVIVLGLIHLHENEWTVMLQHCPPELRILPPPGWQGAPQGYTQGAPSPPVWTTPSPPQAWNADVASIASGSSGSGLSATTTLAGAANAGKKHKYAGSVASGYAGSYSSNSPQSQYPEYDDASTIGGKYNYPTICSIIT